MLAHEVGEGRGGGEEGAAAGADVEGRILVVGGQQAEALLLVEEGVGGGDSGDGGGGGFLGIGFERVSGLGRVRESGVHAPCLGFGAASSCCSCCCGSLKGAQHFCVFGLVLL